MKKYLTLIAFLILFYVLLEFIPKRFQYSFFNRNNVDAHYGNYQLMVVNYQDAIYISKFGEKTLHEEKLDLCEDSRIVSRNAIDKVKWYKDNFKHLPDKSLIPSPKYSKMFLSTHKTEFKVGEMIRVKIHLYNNENKSLRTGGDILRIWLTDKSSNSSSSGYIVDHGNGKYTGFIKAVFPGKPMIKAYFAISKYHVGIAYDYMEREGIWYTINAKFERKNGSSTMTRCSTIPKFSFGKETCNFTRINYGLSWYCVKPEENDLACDSCISFSREYFNYLLQKQSYQDFFMWVKYNFYYFEISCNIKRT